MYSVATYATPVILAEFYGLVAVGLYALAQRLIVLPLNTYLTSFSEAFYQLLSEAYHEGQIATQKIVRSSISGLIKVVTIPYLLFLGVLVFGTGFIFGEQWSDAGLYSLMLSPYVYLTFISRPLSFIFKVYNKQHIGASYHGIRAVVAFSAIALASYYGCSALEAIYWFSVASFLVNLWIQVMAMRVLELPLFRLQQVAIFVTAVSYVLIYSQVL